MLLLYNVKSVSLGINCQSNPNILHWSEFDPFIELGNMLEKVQSTVLFESESNMGR